MCALIIHIRRQCTDIYKVLVSSLNFGLVYSSIK
jgi:hypothetical protein